MFKNLKPGVLGVTGHQCEMIELALTYGFQGMDLDAVDFAARVKLKGLDYAKRLIVSAQKVAPFKIGTFTLPVNLGASDEYYGKDMARLPEICEAMAAIDCTVCVLTLPPANDDRPYHENFEFHKTRLISIAKILEDQGIKLAIGFEAAEYLRKDCAFQFIHDLEALTLLVKMVGKPNVGILLDVWNVFVGGGNIDTIRGLQPEQIMAVQLAELPEGVSLADVDASSRVLPGEGDGRVDLVGTLEILGVTNYEGPITVVPSRGIFKTRRRDMIVKRTSFALDRIWQAAGLTPEGKPGGTVVTLEESAKSSFEEQETKPPVAPEAEAETEEEVEAEVVVDAIDGEVVVDAVEGEVKGVDAVEEK